MDEHRHHCSTVGIAMSREKDALCQEPSSNALGHWFKSQSLPLIPISIAPFWEFLTILGPYLYIHDMYRRTAHSSLVPQQLHKWRKEL